jgi:hypothetical protein
MTTRLRRSAVKALLIHITYVALLGHFLLLALGALDALVAARLGLPRITWLLQAATTDAHRDREEILKWSNQ